ncbi:hypothetical protein [Arenimonas alkanexedens]
MSLSHLILPALLVIAASPTASAQSSALSEASAYSVAPSVEGTAALLSLIPAGSSLVLQAIRPLAGSVELVLVSAATGASIAIEVGAHLLAGLGLVVGATVIVTAVSAGYLLSIGAEILAFVPDALTHSLIHHAEMHR